MAKNKIHVLIYPDGLDNDFLDGLQKILKKYGLYVGDVDWELYGAIWGDTIIYISDRGKISKKELKDIAEQQ